MPENARLGDAPNFPTFRRDRLGDAPNFPTFRRTAWSVIALLASGCSLILPLDGQPDGPVGEAAVLEQGAKDAVADVPVEDGGPDGGASTCLNACTTTSWCTLGSGVTMEILDLAGPDLNNLWAVGAGGTVLQFAPGTCTWTPVSVPPSVLPISTDVTAVWASSKTAVWASSKTTVHLGTKDGKLLLNKGGWTSIYTGTGSINDIVADPAGSVIAVGNSGQLLQFVDQANPPWTELASDTEQHLYAAVATGTGSFVVGGTQGILLTVDSSTKTIDAHTCTTQSGVDVINGLWTNGADLVGVGESNGVGVIVMSTSANCIIFKLSAVAVLNAVAGYSMTEVYAVGNSGTVLPHGQSTSVSIASPTQVDLNAVWVNPLKNPKMLIVAGANGQIWGRKLP